MDQNNNGILDAGDVSNTNNLKTLTTVPLSGASLTLPTSPVYSVATTSYYNSTSSSGSSASYSVAMGLSYLLKQPVAVVLTTSANSDGANAVVPQDIGICNNCGGNAAFGAYAVTSNVVPTVGDSYGFSVTYSDTSTGTATATVAGVLGPTALATNLSPSLSSSTSLTPTFTWTYPTNSSNYTYSFQFCCYNNSNIWQLLPSLPPQPNFQLLLMMTNIIQVFETTFHRPAITWNQHYYGKITM